MSSRGIRRHGVAVKPGKPTVFGSVDGKPVLGMPGYPTSCLSNGYLLLVPMLRFARLIFRRVRFFVIMPSPRARQA